MEAHEKSSWNNKISKEEVNGFPLVRYEGVIELVDTDEKLREVLAELVKEVALGFDTETRPAFKKGESYLPSILQLAGSEKVYVFQLAKLTEFDGLVSLLSNTGIVKAGVGIEDDLLKLKKVIDFEPQGFVEIGGIASKCGLQNTGLRNLAAILFGCRISKNMQVSNWSKADLTDSQINYAATDAWMSRRIYLALQAE